MRLCCHYHPGLPLLRELEQYLQQIIILPPVIPVLNNVDVAVYSTADSIRNGLTRQLFMPVRWVETIQAMAKVGVLNMIECGPGKVLSGLNKRIAANLQFIHTADLSSLRHFLQTPVENQ